MKHKDWKAFHKAKEQENNSKFEKYIDGLIENDNKRTFYDFTDEVQFITNNLNQNLLLKFIDIFEKISIHGLSGEFFKIIDFLQEIYTFYKIKDQDMLLEYFIYAQCLEVKAALLKRKVSSKSKKLSRDDTFDFVWDYGGPDGRDLKIEDLDKKEFNKLFQIYKADAKSTFSFRLSNIINLLLINKDFVHLAKINNLLNKTHEKTSTAKIILDDTDYALSAYIENVKGAELLEYFGSEHEVVKLIIKKPQKTKTQ